MREVGVLEAKTHLSSLLDEVELEGADILITRHGRPIARLSPHLQSPAGISAAPRAEMVEKFRALRERIARESPEVAAMSWDEMKTLARR